MKIADVDLDQAVLVVAEIGNNHEGSYTLAEEMIGLAARAGVGAVKFQTFHTEHYVSHKDPARFSRLKSFELTYSEFEKLSQVAQQAGLLFLSTPFDVESAIFLNPIVPAVKIASGDNNFYPLLETVALFGKPIILSSGLTDLAQISYAKAFIEHTWQEAYIEQDMVVLHCITSYPVTPTEANLAIIPQLKQQLNCTIGYSDHTLGIEAAVLAVALGARLIEKHFTLDKNHSDFRDHQLSADPAEMAVLVERVKQVTTLLGSGEKAIQPSERALVNLVRRSIVAKRDLPAGTILCWDDLTWTRPADGLPPGKEKLVLGKLLTKSVQMGELIRLEMLEEPDRA